MSQEILNIVLSTVSIVVTALLSFGVKTLISWLETKITDKKMLTHLKQITTIVADAVRSVYQSFVETLKTNGKFDATAQKQAKERALTIINSQLTPELKDYIVKNYGDMQEWLSMQIESTLYTLKN